MCSKRVGDEAVSAPRLLRQCEKQIFQLQMLHVLRQGHTAVQGSALELEAGAQAAFQHSVQLRLHRNCVIGKVLPQQPQVLVSEPRQVHCDGLGGHVGSNDLR